MIQTIARPLARKQGLIVREVQNELVIYDSKRKKAFCLNRTCSLVWKNCDGENTVAEITRMLQSVDSSFGESTVWFALQQLESDGLVEEFTTAPADSEGLTRNDLISRFGLTASLVPLVSVLAAASPSKVLSSHFRS